MLVLFPFQNIQVLSLQWTTLVFLNQLDITIDMLKTDPDDSHIQSRWELIIFTSILPDDRPPPHPSPPLSSLHLHGCFYQQRIPTQ